AHRRDGPAPVGEDVLGAAAADVEDERGAAPGGPVAEAADDAAQRERRLLVTADDGDALAGRALQRGDEIATVRGLADGAGGHDRQAVDRRAPRAGDVLGHRGGRALARRGAEPPAAREALAQARHALVGLDDAPAAGLDVGDEE